MSKKFGPDQEYIDWYNKQYPPKEGCDPVEREKVITQWWCITYEDDLRILSDLSYCASQTDEERKESTERFDRLWKEYDEWHHEYFGPPKLLKATWTLDANPAKEG